MKQVRAEKGVADFFYVNPGTYYLRLTIDLNGNGLWDTGDYGADLQAESMYYYPREIECKEKWDVSQVWDVSATPRYRQKPGKITKQKPDAEKKLKNRNIKRAEELGITYNKIEVKKEKGKKSDKKSDKKDEENE